MSLLNKGDALEAFGFKEAEVQDLLQLCLNAVTLTKDFGSCLDYVLTKLYQSKASYRQILFCTSIVGALTLDVKVLDLSKVKDFNIPDELKN